MRTKVMLKTHLALALLALSLPALGFNPSSIPRNQKEAPEQLEIEVTKIEEKKVKRGEVDYVAMEVEAKVGKVVKSATGIKEGETVRISWLIPQGDVAIGGGWPAKIKKGQYQAYLRVDEKDSKRYIPAAYTGTFVAKEKPGAKAN